MICGYHFPFPGAGTIDKDGSGYALDRHENVSGSVARRSHRKMEIIMKIACALDFGAARRRVARRDRRARRRQRHLARRAGPHLGARQDQGQGLQGALGGAHAHARDAISTPTSTT